MLTEKQKEIASKIESLVHKRYNKELLTDFLKTVFNEEIELILTDSDTSDYNYVFESKKDETYGFFDIYFLKMKTWGFDGSNIYITEVNYEF